MPYCTIFTTVPSREDGVKLARLLVAKKLAACANLLNGVESYFWWKKKIETAYECLLIFKTEAAKSKPAISTLKKLHPYQVPEIIVLPIVDGYPPYLKWISDSLK